MLRHFSVSRLQMTDRQIVWLHGYNCIRVTTAIKLMMCQTMLAKIGQLAVKLLQRNILNIKSRKHKYKTKSIKRNCKFLFKKFKK